MLPFANADRVDVLETLSELLPLAVENDLPTLVAAPVLKLPLKADTPPREEPATTAAKHARVAIFFVVQLFCDLVDDTILSVL